MDTIRGIYGAALAKELLALQATEPAVGLEMRGYVSNANHASKKLTFLLFINKRLVESTALRRAIEEVHPLSWLRALSYIPLAGHSPWLVTAPWLAACLWLATAPSDP